MQLAVLAGWGGGAMASSEPLAVLSVCIAGGVLPSSGVANAPPSSGVALHVANALALLFPAMAFDVVMNSGSLPSEYWGVDSGTLLTIHRALSLSLSLRTVLNWGYVAGPQNNGSQSLKWFQPLAPSKSVQLGFVG